MAFKFTGFADEASTELDQQIEVVKEAGWNAIELRSVNETNVCDLSDGDWATTLQKLNDSDITVAGFGGQIANWGRPVSSDFDADMDELKRCAPRMREAGTNLIRIMSYPNDQDNPWSEADWKAEVFKRLKDLATVAEGEGVILGHENCSGYAGLGPDQYLETVEAVNSPSFKLIFDSGNNTLHDKDPEATWRYYEACRNEIVHVHIKACKPGDDGEYTTCYPDEDPVQERVLRALVADGYDGWLSIEPHMHAAIHLGQQADGDASRTAWLEYTRRIEALAATASS